MSLFKRLERKIEQRKGNAFIRRLNNKSELEVKKIYLDSKDITNNEIVLSHLFFTYPSIISVLPVEFQKKMLNSNFPMFKYGSVEAKRALVSQWLKDNKFIINCRSLNLDQDEYESYMCMYFNQPEDIAKLYMEDLTIVLTILKKYNFKKTEEIVKSMSDKLTDRQWDFILKVDKSFIKYANQNVQQKYSEDEDYVKFISGPARDNYIKSQINKIKDDPSVLSTLPLDIQKEYIDAYPYMINYIDESIVSELIKYDENLVRYLNVATLSNNETIYELLESAILNNNIVNIFVDKSLLNAKGKLYRFDKTSSNFTYQYNKRIIKIIQTLSLEQIITLIDIDVNYVLPYIVPLYNDNNDELEKKDITLEANSRCLNLFKKYFGDSTYSKYYQTINKIYSEYIAHIDTYDYNTDYNCIFELFTLLFNKKIIINNSSEKINLYIGIMLLYKGKETDESKKSSSDLFKSFIKRSYNYDMNDGTIYDLPSLELFDSRYSFISSELLEDFQKYNFVNISSLLHIVKDDSLRELFIYYYDIVSNIFGNNKEMLFKSLENFIYYKDLIKDVKDSELNDEQIDNLVDILSSFNNNLNIKTKEELIGYDLALLKKLINDLSDTKDEMVYKDLFCKYFFGKSFSIKGNTGLLDTDTLEQLCDVYDSAALEEIKVNGENKYSKDEVDFFAMIQLLLTANNQELLMSFIDNVIDKKVSRNILPIISLFEKLDDDQIELINAQIVSVNDIEMLYQSDNNAVSKTEEEGVIVYRFHNQDFKLLVSYNDNGTHYECKYLSTIMKNCYGYDSIKEGSSIRYVTYEGNTVIKMNKDDLQEKMRPNFIVVNGNISPDVFKIAASNNLRIIATNNVASVPTTDTPNDFNAYGTM